MPNQRAVRVFRSCVRGIAVLFLAQSTLSSAQTILEEIIVTATKREESVQDVSVSMTALTGDMIQAFGFQDALEVFNQIPNVFADQGSYSGALTIRGNATLNTTLAGEGNVALYFDDVYRPQAYYGGNNLLDLERVEVLRGPQGTLFGRNSTAGLVHFISRKPTDEFEAYATVEAGSYDTRIIEGAVSGPLSDSVSGRLAIQYHEDDGFQDNLGPAGGKLGKTDRLAGRGHLKFELGERADLLLTVEASDRDDIGKGFHYWGLLDPTTLEQCDAQRVRAGACVGGGAFFGLPTFGDPDLDPERVYTELDPNNGENSYTLETTTGIARLNFSLTENIELVSITAFDSMSRAFNPDEDASVVGVLGGLFSFNDFYTQDSDQFTQELRLEGTHGEIDWTGGFYYFDEEAGTADAYNHIWSDPLVTRFVDKLAVTAVIGSASEAGVAFAEPKRKRRKAEAKSPGIYFFSETGRSLGVLRGALDGQEGIGQVMLMLGAADYARNESQDRKPRRYRHMRYH